MADYHYKYETHEKEDTEWEALHRKLGNLPQKPKKKPPLKFKPKEDPKKDEQFIDRQDEDGLEDLEDDFDDDAFLEQYRQKRLQELKNQKKVTEFGKIVEIRGGEFIAQVTEASENTWIVVLLFQPNHSKCEQLEVCLEELAADFTQTKFVKILSEECIAGYPREHLPTLLIYHNRSCKRTIAGSEAFRSGRLTSESIVEMLNKVGPVCQQ